MDESANEPKLGASVSGEAVKFHYEAATLVIDELKLYSINIQPYREGDEKYGVFPIKLRD